MPWPTSTAWPTANDSSYGSGAARVDAVDIVWARDVNFLYTQTEAFQDVIGTSGRLIGEVSGTGTGPGGLISPKAPGVDNGIVLATWDEYISAGGNDIFKIIDDWSGAGAGPTTVAAIDDAGIMSLLGGIDIGSTEYLEIPHGNSLPLTFEEGRIFRKDDTDTLYHADGAGWNVVDVATAIHDNVAAEISAIAAKATPVAADYLVIEDSAAGDAKKSITIGTLPVKSEFTCASNESVTMGGAATEVVIGQFTYDGSIATTIAFESIIEPSAAVTCEVRLYDRGPIAGPPVAAVMAAKLVTASSGLQVLSETLTSVVDPTLTWPDSNDIYNTDRMYEVRGYINGAPGDILYVGKVALTFV